MKPPPLPTPARYPAGEYGRFGLPAQSAALVIRDATVWMTGAAAPLEHADVLIERGRISAVGADLAVPKGAVEIDGRGKHLTPGLIDAHSHIAVSGNINEPSHAITAEVRIGDVKLVNEDKLYHDATATLKKAEQAVEGLSDSGAISVLGSIIGTLF